MKNINEDLRKYPYRVDIRENLRAMIKIAETNQIITCWQVMQCKIIDDAEVIIEEYLNLRFYFKSKEEMNIFKLLVE